MIQISGTNTNFLSGVTTVGFGTSDIVVKQVFVITPTSLWVNVSVNPQAAPLTVTNVTVTTGLQIATFSPDLGTGAGVQILQANPGQISMHAPITNLSTGLGGVPSGGTAVINTTGPMPQNLTGWILTIGGQQATPYYNNGQLQATVPNGLSNTVPAIVQLISPSGPPIPTLAMKIDALPPSIGTVLNAAGGVVSSTTPVNPGDILTITMAGLFDNVTPLTIGNLFASVDGITGGLNGASAISVPVLQFGNPVMQVQIPYSTPAGASTPLYVGLGTRVASPIYLNIQ
jgi:hypothetical protein